MADNHINEAEREVIERAIRFIENGSHTYIARDTMANELRKLAARRTPVADGAAPENARERLRRTNPGFLAHLDRCSAEVKAWPGWKSGMWPAETVADGAALDLPELQPLETVQYWAREFAKDPQRLAGGMIVKLLQEYATLRAHYLRKQAGHVFLTIKESLQVAGGERQSIDTPEFRRLTDEIYGAGQWGDSDEKEVAALIDHIDTWASRSAGDVVPAGFKLVPLQPTNKMTAIGQDLRYKSVNSIGEIYRQMIGAAPAPGNTEKPGLDAEPQTSAQFSALGKEE